MKLKFNHIQDLSDARYAAAAMAEWIGFRVGEIPLAQVQEIIGWCAGPKLTLELDHIELLDTVVSWCDILPVDAIECSDNDLSFWQSHLQHREYEWIINRNNVSHVMDQKDTKIHCVDPAVMSLQEIKNQAFDAISLNCKKETVVGMKNYDLWNELLETLEIW